MSRSLPVVVLDHAAAPLAAGDFAGLDRPGVIECGGMRPRGMATVTRFLALLAACLAACLSAAPASAQHDVSLDAGRRASWPLQDAGGDVIAICDRGGANGTTRVITQIVYDAHGGVIDCDDPYGTAASPGKELRVGHKGLFFDRLDAGISDPATGAETPRLWPGARLSGYTRNRTLHCDFGRWNQPDPNMTGLPVQQAFVFHGSGLRESVQGFDLRGHFTDGANVFAYLGGAPCTRFDPLGTSMMVEMMGTMGVRGMLAGALVGGIFGGVQGYQNGDIVGGVARGMIVGAVAGGFGGMGAAVAQSAFAASAAGLWASVIQGSAVWGVGGFTGGLAGSAQAQMMDGRAVDWRVAFADAATTSAWGMATGGLSNALGWMSVSQGSTGRTMALSLREQLAMAQARSNPASGMVLQNIRMTDPRWPASAGWVKMSQNINGMEIHYVFNRVLRIADDFKFK